MLWFAREAALGQGWSALEVLGEPGEHPDPIEWQRAAAEAALAAADSERVLVIGKSLVIARLVPEPSTLPQLARRGLRA